MIFFVVCLIVVVFVCTRLRVAHRVDSFHVQNTHVTADTANYESGEPVIDNAMYVEDFEPEFMNSRARTGACTPGTHVAKSPRNAVDIATSTDSLNSQALTPYNKKRT